MPGALIVANHISWIDVFAINAVLPSAFVAKEEVRHWPLIGWLAKKSDTVFLRRGSHGHARIINREIAEILGKGNHVAVFPEGTTTDGTHLLHFHAALIQPALAVGRPVLPLAISYWEADGSRSLAPGYVGDLSLMQCTLAIAGCKGLVARVITCPVLGLAGEDRRQVAVAAREAIGIGAGLVRHGMARSRTAHSVIGAAGICQPSAIAALISASADYRKSVADFRRNGEWTPVVASQ